MTDQQVTRYARLINVAALLALLGVLAGSLYLQFDIGEQPCPLCLVQRSGMIGLAVGPVMNLLWGMRPAHYALSILAASVGMAGSVRQILLHINDPIGEGYGPAVLGWHLYTWAAVTFAIAIVGCALLLLWTRPFIVVDQGVLTDVRWMRLVSLFAITWLFLDLLAIGVSVLPECGLGMCPDDPENLSGGWPVVFILGLVSAVVAYLLDRRLEARLTPAA